MKINFIKKYVVLSIVSAMVLFQSCEKDPDPVVKAGEAGFFIVNEGGYPNPNTSISFYDRKTGAVTNDLFVAKNGRPLGLQAQSMSVFEGKGYIVVQGDSKIEIINPDDFSSLSTISEGIPSPRYFLGVTATKAYVSDWGVDGVTGTVKVIDLSMNKITKKVILNTTKDSLNDIADQLQIDLNKKTKKAIERLATRFSILMKNEITKQTKRN